MPEGYRVPFNPCTLNPVELLLAWLLCKCLICEAECSLVVLTKAVQICLWLNVFLVVDISIFALPSPKNEQTLASNNVSRSSKLSTLHLHSALTDSSQESESHINMVAMSSLTWESGVCCCKPTFHTAPSTPSHVLVCVFTVFSCLWRELLRATHARGSWAHLFIKACWSLLCVKCVRVCFPTCEGGVGKQRRLKVVVVFLPLCGSFWQIL